MPGDGPALENRGHTRQGRAHSGPHVLPGRTFLHFFRYYLPYGIRSSPVCSLCWPSTSIAGWHTAAFPGNRPFPFPLKIGEYFVFSSRNAGTFTSSDCFGHRVRIRTVKEGTTQDASGLLWLFFLIRNISGKKPDHWIKSGSSVFLGKIGVAPACRSPSPPVGFTVILAGQKGLGMNTKIHPNCNFTATLQSGQAADART